MFVRAFSGSKSTFYAIIALKSFFHGFIEALYDYNLE